MTAKKFFKLRDELCRRVWLAQKGNLKGFGKSQKAMRGKVPNFEAFREQTGADHVLGYDELWNSPVMKSLRETVGM